MMQCCQFLTW